MTLQLSEPFGCDALTGSASQAEEHWKKLPLLASQSTNLSVETEPDVFLANAYAVPQTGLTVIGTIVAIGLSSRNERSHRRSGLLRRLASTDTWSFDQIAATVRDLLGTDKQLAADVVALIGDECVDSETRAMILEALATGQQLGSGELIQAINMAFRSRVPELVFTAISCLSALPRYDQARFKFLVKEIMATSTHAGIGLAAKAFLNKD